MNNAPKCGDYMEIEDGDLQPLQGHLANLALHKKLDKMAHGARPGLAACIHRHCLVSRCPMRACMHACPRHMRHAWDRLNIDGHWSQHPQLTLVPSFLMPAMHTVLSLLS